ncbi:conserved hypothetical protein [Verticillium alfalfae VaMs.102]|uniref:Rrn9 domain-containing protein n=1 Tax=Verticillium alfalfae (strain VaMs.102 / ATCC MYA-4576 / FGSC 10136) TaxID=526221 RepID=C9SR04_VERA1|nr:conserved hypothetical protein [Verticillium alfalfae VaMs.102]EEY21279.1 conserved hypothetical protein [Verticillium alfalfae VaMs.102]
MAVVPDDDWDLDTDEIRSTASDELYETRPNRWRGPLSTWRHMTEEERLLHQNMEQVRDQDLALHLFNAAMLRNPPQGSQDALPEGMGLGDWRPPQAWTAWPLPVEALPREKLLRETRDAHDAFTLRRKDEWRPGKDLEEEVSASMLRIAKERFRERKFGQGDEPSEAGRHSDEDSAEESEDAHFDDADGEPLTKGTSEGEEAESEDSDESQDGDEHSVQDEAEQHQQPPEDEVPARTTKASKQYAPVVSADDDLSYELLRPSARHILTKLDATLTTLHNARMAGVVARDQTDDSASDRSSVISDAETEVAISQKRVANARYAKKRPAPASSTSSSSEEDDADDESASEKTPRGRPIAPRKRRPSKRGVSASSRDSDSDTSRAYRMWRDSRLNRWGLRDWRDVLGAAALAGFDADVVARAAQRCADLFGQSMELHTVSEGQEGYLTTTCYPGKPLPAAQDDGEEDEERHLEETRRRLRYEAIQLRRARERRAGRAPAGADTQDSDDDDDGDAPRSRSRNGPTDEDNDSSGVELPVRPKLEIDLNAVQASPDGLFYCPITHCKRHTKGFGQDWEEAFKLIPGQPAAPKGGILLVLSRTGKYHVGASRREKNPHRTHCVMCISPELACLKRARIRRDSQGKGKGTEQTPAMQMPSAGNQGSDEEMDGAVHVDGFLRPIKIRQGWLSKGGREKGQRNRGTKDHADG